MNVTIINSVWKGGDNMEKDMIRSLVAGMGIAGLVAGTTLAAPALAAESGDICGKGRQKSRKNQEKSERCCRQRVTETQGSTW